MLYDGKEFHVLLEKLILWKYLCYQTFFYINNITHFKFLMSSFRNLEHTIQEFIWNFQRPEVAKEILNEKEHFVLYGNTQSKLYNGAIVIKKPWYLNKISQVDQRNRIENLGGSTKRKLSPVNFLTKEAKKCTLHIVWNSTQNLSKTII